MSSAMSLIVLFMLKSCFESNAVPHSGHIELVLRSLWLVMQAIQKLCPQEVVTGSVNTSRQIEHVTCSDKLLGEAMTLLLRSYTNTDIHSELV